MKTRMLFTFFPTRRVVSGLWPSATCIIHVGTHKTGSTTLQQFLKTNTEAFARVGILVPVSGRLGDTPEGSGHHCIAWDVLGADPSAPVDGSLESLIEEIRVAALPIVCISSEEFSHLHAIPNNMQRLKQGLHGIGYRAVIVMYLRPQVDYFEALYAEVAQHARVRDFWACYREVLKHGAVDFWPENRFSALYDYERLIAPFRRTFGDKNVIVRPFRRFAAYQQLTRDFTKIVVGTGSAFECDTIDSIGARNARGRFANVVASIYRNRHGNGVGAGLPQDFSAQLAANDGPFEVLRAHEVARICSRFARSNLALYRRYGVWVGGVSGIRLLHMLMTMADFRQGRARVKLLRSVFVE